MEAGVRLDRAACPDEPAVRVEQLGSVAAEFDRIHDIHRAVAVGSVQRVIAAARLRPYLIDAVEGGLARDYRGAGGVARDRGERG